MFTIAGALLVNYLSQEILKAVLGLFILAFSVVSLLKPGFQFSPTRTNAITGGDLSGFLAGLIGTGGALRGAFLTAFGLEKSIYIDTAATIALAVDVTRIPIYVSGGFLESRYYFYIPLLLVVALAGSYLGKSIVAKVPQKVFRTWVLVALIVISIKFIIDGFGNQMN